MGEEIPLEPPRKIRGRTRGFQLPESRANRGPTERPRSPKLETWHHMRTSNERLDRAVGTPYRDRRPGEPGMEATRGTDARRSRWSSTKGADSPSKAEGHSRTPAPDAKATAATLLYDRSQWLQAEMGKQHSPQREELLQQQFRDNGRPGDSNCHHTLPHLTPGSPAALPIPLADRGEKRPLAITKTAREIAGPRSVTATTLASTLKLLPWPAAATAAIGHARAISEGPLAVRKPPPATLKPLERTQWNR